MTPLAMKTDHFERFRSLLDHPELIERLRAGLIGEGVMVPGPRGPQPLVYADYVASGRALRQIEDFMIDEILPIYANSHTEASFCGMMMTRLRQQARRVILQACGGNDQYDVIFTGSGATAGINRLVHLLGVATAGGDAPRPLVLIGPYEHHSNILPWRESGAEVVEIPEAAGGGPDLDLLKAALSEHRGRKIVAAFSAMSNVTGIVTDVKAVTRLVKSHGAISIWDYAGGAPYMQIDLAGDAAAQIDAVVMSPHKFIGGPGASGILILRRQAIMAAKPTMPGGGTVRFVSPWSHDYSADVIAREEAGTPNVAGDLRAALCFIVKDAIGQDYTDTRLEALRQRAQAAWSDLPGLTLLGNPNARRLPIFSFTVTDPSGQQMHQQLVTRMLSDHHGVQARGGCACAGPYAHRLLGIDKAHSERLRGDILAGHEVQKPGWTRLGFSVLMTDAKADRIIAAVRDVVRSSHADRAAYRLDEATARFSLGGA